MAFARSSGFDIYYEVAGAGRPPLVFIHGFTCDHSDWGFQKQDLAPKYQIVTCDLRGHGQSGGSGSACTIADLAADIGVLLHSLQLRDAVLVGHSLGCRVVLETYAQNPQLVAGIILIDGSIAGTGDPRQVLASTRTLLDEAGYATFVQRTFDNMFFGDYDIALKSRIAARALRLDPEFGAALRSNNVAWDAANMEAVLSRVRVPLLAIQSTDFTSMLERFRLRKGDSTPWLQMVRKLVPAARVEILPGPGHFVMLEAPDATNALIDSFAAELRNDVAAWRQYTRN